MLKYIKLVESMKIDTLWSGPCLSFSFSNVSPYFESFILYPIKSIRSNNAGIEVSNVFGTKLQKSYFM